MCKVVYRALKAALTLYCRETTQGRPLESLSLISSASELNQTADRPWRTMSANSQPPKAVLELSQKLQENATRLKQLDAQKRALETDIRRAVITAHHLNEVKDDTVTYKSVGKAYMRVERAEILDNLEASVKAWDTEAKACKGNMDRLVKVQEGLVKELQEVR